MINRRQSNYFKKIFFNQKFLTLLGLAAIILISLPFAKNTIKQYRINKEISELKKEISELQNKSVDLKKFVSYLESDQFSEEQARLSLGLKKPGEELAVIKMENGGESSGASASSTVFNIPGYNKKKSPPKQSNPQRWLNYFIN